MTVRLKSLIAAGCLTFLYGIYYWGIPAFVNLPQRVDFIKSTAQKQGYNITLENPQLKMGLKPAVILYADKLTLLNNDNTPALDLKKPYVKVELLPFLFKKADIKDFTAENIYARISYDKTLKLGQYPIDLNQKPPLKLQHAKVKFNGYDIDMTDLTNGKSLKLAGQYLEVASFNPDKELKFSTIADIYSDGKVSKFNADIETPLPVNKITEDTININGQIINLDLDNFTPYARVLSKNKIQKLSGIVNGTAQTELTNDNHKKIVTHTEIKNLGVFEKNPAANILCKDKLKIDTDLTVIKDGINISKMHISAPDINSDISGAVTKLTSKLPVLDLNINISDTKAESLLPLLPGIEDFEGEINLLKIKETGFWGDVQANLKVKGKADFPDVIGNVTIKEAYLVKPIPNSPKAIIDLDFTGQKVVLDVHVPTTQVQYVDVTGPIELYRERNADLKITSTENINLALAEVVLNPLHEIFKFDLGPVPIMDIKGSGNIDLHVTGNKKLPHAWGQFNFKNTTASFNDIHHLVLQNGSGKLTFDDADTHFVTYTATLNGQPVSVDGTCTLQGVLDFDVTANNQKLENLINVIKSSPMLVDIQQMIAPIEKAQGPANLKLNLTGKVKDPKDIVFNKNIFAKGSVKMLSDTLRIQGIPFDITNVSGTAGFENTKVNLDLLSSVKSSKIKITGNIQDQNCDMKISSDKLLLSDILSSMPEINLPYKEDFAKIHTSFNASYFGSLSPVNYDAVTMKGRVYPVKGRNIILNGGEFELKNSTFKLFEQSGYLKGSPYKLNASVHNAFDKTPEVDGEFTLKNFNLNNLNDNAIREFLPPDIAKQLNAIKDLQGIINLTCKIKNNNLRAFTRLNNISLIYAPAMAKLKIASGHLFLNNDTLYLGKLNSKFGEMPVLLDGSINKIYSKNPGLNLYINAKPTQEFFDQFFNNKSLYPVKLKGDILLTSRITGRLNKIRIMSNLKLDEDSSLYYMGASLGDNQNPVTINLDSYITPQGITLNRFQYDKTITSQNNRPIVTPQLSAAGAITYLPDNNLKFNNFRIKTQSPTDAKIFNIIFRKPIMKQGVFTSDLLLNGTTQNPKIRGKFEVTSIDIPFLDSTIKDISLDFKPDKIYAKSRGVLLTNNITLEAVAANRLTPPYIIEDVQLKLADLDLNKLTAMLRDLEAEATTRKRITTQTNSIPAVDISQVILKNADITANTITVRNIHANNLVANLSLNEKMLLDISKFKFNIAEGTVTGRFTNNLLNRAVTLSLNLDRANAQMMTEALFDLKGQIYGSMTGNVNLLCNGRSYEKCMQTLSGSGSFSVSDGKMPKLGSLEYLLKAGNLLSSGFMGLSINSIIDFITPLKTGEFNSISGDIKIQNGIVNPVNIYSDGKDLNMYLTGSYNIVTSLADMHIFGSLSRNVTSVFGKIKNASLNTLLNTIPGINKDEEPAQMQEEIAKIPGIKTQESTRIFNAEIYGDINGENYVKSFRWIK